MARMSVRKFAAALGVIIALAMTPRAALAVTLEDFPSYPIVQRSVGSSPTLLTPSEVISNLSNSNNVYPNSSISEVYGGYTTTESGSITNNTSSTALTSSHGYIYDNTTPITRTYDYLVGYYSASVATSGSTVYMDFYFVSDDWKTFPSNIEYTVVTPSIVHPFLFRLSNESNRPSAYFTRLAGSSFVVDEIKYYRKSIVNNQPDERWTDVPNSASASMRYPYHAKAQNGTNGLKGFVIRGHFVMPSFSTLSGYDQQLFFGIDNLKIRNVIYDSDVMATINGSSSQSSTGVPVTTTITNSTNNQTQTLTQNTEKQTDTLMDTEGSSDILSGLSSDGVSGLTDRLGFIAQTIEISENFVDSIRTAGRKSSLHFPGVTVMGITLYPEQDVNFNQSGLGPVIDGFVRPFFTGYLCICWVFGMKRAFEIQILGYTADPLEAKETE